LFKASERIHLQIRFAALRCRHKIGLRMGSATRSHESGRSRISIAVTAVTSLSRSWKRSGAQRLPSTWCWFRRPCLR
jgi:hypothetical protein